MLLQKVVANVREPADVADPTHNRGHFDGILNTRFRSVNRFIVISVFVLITSLILAFFIKYTYYAPDAYVFVQYAYLDGIERNLNINSIVSNNFIFDLMIIIGDLFDFYTPVQWINYTICIYVAIFATKYIFLLRNAPLFPVIIVYFASFFIDINQLRFNLALLLLFTAHIHVTKKKQIIFFPLSFVSHVIPMFIYVLSILKKKPFIMMVFLTFSTVIIAYSGYFALIENSRLFSYADQEQDGIPKVLLLAFPLIYGLIYLRRTDSSLDFIRDYCIVLLFIGVAISPLNYFLTARFFETSFVIFTIYNCLSRERRPELDLLLLVSSLAVMSSRLISGIRAGADFAERYVEVWKF